jgi:endoglucanase Acf2
LQNENCELPAINLQFSFFNLQFSILILHPSSLIHPMPFHILQTWQVLLRAATVLAIVACFSARPAVAQRPVSAGKGSYAEYPPPDAGRGALDMVQRKFALVDRTDRPIPTNKLWTALLEGKASGSLWMYPWRVDPRESGLELHFPIKWLSSGSDPMCDAPLRVSGVDFRSHGLQVKDWGDWTLSFRLPASESKYIDVTIGEGMPIVWAEPHGVELTVDAGRDATFTTINGAPVTFPSQGNTLVIAAAGRLYGLFVPPGTQFTQVAGKLLLQISRGKSFAAFAAIKDRRDLPAFSECAYSIPRGSRMDWAYDARRGKVTTTWTVKTEPLLAGKADVVMQGWLAHHWRGEATATKLDGPQYLTPRGLMQTAIGNRFQWVYDFDGFLPNLPAPREEGRKLGAIQREPGMEKRGMEQGATQRVPGRESDRLSPCSLLPAPRFDPQWMAQLLDNCARNPKYGDDSYWGGKDLLRFAQYMQMARELKSPEYGRLRELSRKSLADWLTYTPGEKAHYFTRYANWHALIGIKDSYDSARFNDQHFHYGYLTLSAALLGMEDPRFLADYGPMLRLVAKQYANWDRDDARFPFLRTFDIWAGHSWAGGLGSPGGNNQESSSEAMQSWIGLYLLGTMLDDAQMTAAGAMGYAMESRATMEYWFNVHGDILPAEYKHPIVGVLWSGGLVYGTYFSGDPGWIYGIQCLPQSPGLDYLVRDRRFAAKAFGEALAARKKKEGSDDLARMGDLGSVLLAQASLSDPEWAIGEFDRLWDANSPIVHKHFGAGTTYYNAHAYSALGYRLWNVHLSVPTSAVYYNAATKTVSFVVYNPKPEPVTVEASREGKVLGTLVAGPRQLTCVHKLRTAVP